MPAPIETETLQNIAVSQDAANPQSGEDPMQAAEVIPEDKEALI